MFRHQNFIEWFVKICIFFTMRMIKLENNLCRFGLGFSIYLKKLITLVLFKLLF